FNDYPRSRDLFPRYRNSQPWIIRSPPADANKKIGRSVLEEFRVQSRDRGRHFVASTTLKAMVVHYDHVMQVGVAAIAEHPGTATDELLLLKRFHRCIFRLPRKNQGTHLQETKIRGTFIVARHANGKFDFHRTAQRVLAQLLQAAQ